MLNYFMPTRIVGGVRENAALLCTLGTRCLLVTGGSSAKKSGALDDAAAALESVGIPFAVFDKIGPNPLISACHAAGDAARDFGADFLLGIGGGSPLDAAKAAAIYAANPSLAPMDIFALTHSKPALPTALIGTTAGTGSEVTRISVLTQDESGRKRSIAADDIYAHVAFADSLYTHSMPFAVTLSTALDALSHAVEGWMKAEANDICKLFGARAIALLWPALARMVQSEALPDAAEREALYAASLYAGLVINRCGTAFCHPMGYILTEDYGVAHGTACAVFLPALLKRSKTLAPEKYAEISAAFAAAGEADMAKVCCTLAALCPLPQVRMNAETLAHYAAYWQASPPKSFAAPSGGIAPEEAAEVLRDLFCRS